jgi:hypothetical protein
MTEIVSKLAKDKGMKIFCLKNEQNFSLQLSKIFPKTLVTFQFLSSTL